MLTMKRIGRLNTRWTTKSHLGMIHHQTFKGVVQEPASLVMEVTFQNGPVNSVVEVTFQHGPVKGVND